MKKYKYLFYIFTGLAVLLSDVMCATVAYNYCNIQCAIQYKGYSAPANTAFLLLLPYAVGIIICAALAWFLHKKSQRS